MNNKDGKRKYIIYLIEDTWSGLNYVGMTSSKYLSSRQSVTKHEAYKKLDDGKWKYQTPIYEAYRRNGKYFRWTALEEFVSHRAYAGEREDFYIRKFNTLFPHGYNCETGGDNGKRVVTHNYSCRKDRHYQKVREKFAGLSDEEKAERSRRISEGLRRRLSDPEFKKQKAERFRKSMKDMMKRREKNSDNKQNQTTGTQTLS